MSLRSKIALVLMFPIIVTLAWFVNHEENPREKVKASTYSTSVNGLKAFFLMLKNLKIPVERMHVNPNQLNTAGTLVICEPLSKQFTTSEFKKLEKWIKGGNTLILFVGSIDDTDDTINKAKPLSDGRLSGLLKLKLKLDYDAPRENVQTSFSHYGQFTINMSGKTRWKDVTSAWEIVAHDDRGPYLVKRKLGDGYVFAFSDSSIIKNKFIRSKENAEFALALLSNEKPKNRILFDEYHQGYGIRQGIAGYVLPSLFGWIMIQSVLLGILFFYSRRAAHGGKFRSLIEPTGRSSTEYVNSMANVLATAKAGYVALEAIVNRNVTKIARMKGLPVNAIFARHYKENEFTNLYSVLDECQKTIDQKQAPEACLKCSQKLTDVMKQFTSGVQSRH